MAHTSIPADSVFAVDLHETYQPAIFMPQQMVIWTGGTDGLLEPDTLFPRYFKYLRAAQTAGLPQPLFVASEPPEQRRAFLRDLAVTHILVNPPRYREMKPVLDGERNLLVSLFDDGRWALYAVRHP